MTRGRASVDDENRDPRVSVDSVLGTGIPRVLDRPLRRIGPLRSGVPPHVVLSVSVPPIFTTYPYLRRGPDLVSYPPSLGMFVLTLSLLDLLLVGALVVVLVTGRALASQGPCLHTSVETTNDRHTERPTNWRDSEPIERTFTSTVVDKKSLLS